MGDWWDNLTPQAKLLWASLLFMAALLAGALVLFLVERWRRTSSAEPDSTNDQLTSFRSLYERGELSREEYERIRNKLGSRLRKEMNVPKPPEASPDPTPPSPPEPPEEGIQPR
jgi:hypothetical protein